MLRDQEEKDRWLLEAVGEYGTVQKVRLLIEAGADVNASDKDSELTSESRDCALTSSGPPSNTISCEGDQKHRIGYTLHL